MKIILIAARYITLKCKARTGSAQMGCEEKMAHETNGELVLNTEETVAFMHYMLHPNVEALMQRDEFLRDLPDRYIDFTNGEITANCPDIQLP